MQDIAIVTMEGEQETAPKLSNVLVWMTLSVRAAAFTLTLFAGGGFHAMRQRLQSELNHLSAEDP